MHKMPLFLLDGDCALCTTRSSRLKRMLPNFLASSQWQWLDLDALGLTRDDGAKCARIVTSTHQHAGHLAPSALPHMKPSRALRFAGNLLATPPNPRAAAAGSRFVTKNQHKLPGRIRASAMPPTEA